MKMDLIYSFEDSVIKGKFIADKSGKGKVNFDGHLEVEVSGETIGVVDVFNVMKDLKKDSLVVTMVSAKVFRVNFIMADESQAIFNGIVSVFEDIYANA
jgi:hypothetical protein